MHMRVLPGGRNAAVRLLVAGALVAALSASMVSCGGGGSSTGAEVGRNVQVSDFEHPEHKPTAAEFRKLADNRCTGMERKLEELDSTPAKGGSVMAQTAMARESLRSVRPPANLKQRYLLFQRYLYSRDVMRGDFFRGEISRLRRARSAQRFKDDTAKAAAVARQLGLKDCPYP